MKKSQRIEYAIDVISELRDTVWSLCNEIDDENVSTPENYTKDQMRFILSYVTQQLSASYTLLTM